MKSSDLPTDPLSAGAGPIPSPPLPRARAFRRVQGVLSVLVLLAGLLVVGAPTALAATYQVTENRITGTADDDPVPDACTATDCSLREAVLAANASPGADLVTFAATGQVRLSRSGAEVVPQAGSNDLDIEEDLTVQGSGITIDASGMSLGDHSRVFEVRGSNLSLTGLTITGARCVCSGGAVHVGGTLTTDGVWFDDNQAQRSGGAIGTEGLETLTVTDSTFSDNHAGVFLTDREVGGNGGAIDIVDSGLAAVTVTDSQFTGNSARSDDPGARGGAIHMDGQTLQVAGSWFDRNGLRGGNVVTLAGGAILSEIGTLTIITDTSVVRNRAITQGGGLWLADQVGVVRTAVLRNEVADGRGGGAFLLSGEALLHNSTFHGNVALDGGSGLHIAPLIQAVPAPTSQVVTPPRQTLPSALDFQQGEAADVVLLHLTLTDNEGDTGLGIETNVEAVLADSILAEHRTNCRVGGVLISDGYNLEDASDCALAEASDLSGTAPQLAPPADNGGPPQGTTPGLATITRLPQPGSPALDSADATICGFGGINNVDQRSVTRPQGSACDRGAAEVGVEDPDPDPQDEPDPGDDPNPDPDPQPDPNPDPEPDPNPDPGPRNGCDASASTEETDPVIGTGITRVEGLNRIQTAIVASQAICRDGQAPAVVLTRADLFPDAQAGTPLAIQLGAPLLLSNPDQLSADTETELDRVLPTGGTVYLLGGTVALSEAVNQRLVDLGYVTVRYGGLNRFGTAAIIADQGLANPTNLLLTNGGDFADSVMAGAAAATYRDAAGAIDAAVLLSSGSDVAAETEAYLSGRADNPTMMAVGGAAVTAYPGIEAVAGPTRIDTATVVADRYFTDPSTIGIARADDFPDALTGGAVVGRPELGPGPIILSDTASLPGPIATWLANHASTIDRIVIFGGPGAISPEVEAAVASALGL